MNISHNGLGEVVTTFETNNQTPINAGALIKLVSGKATVAGEGDEIMGIAADASRHGKIAVQLSGFAEREYMGTPHFGRQYIVAKSTGLVQFCSASTENAIPVKVLSIDSANHIVGFII